MGWNSKHSEHPEHSEHSEHPEHSEQSEHPEHSEHPEQIERSEHSEHSEYSENSEHSENLELSEHSENSELHLADVPALTIRLCKIKEHIPALRTGGTILSRAFSSSSEGSKQQYTPFGVSLYVITSNLPTFSNLFIFRIHANAS